MLACLLNNVNNFCFQSFGEYFSHRSQIVKCFENGNIRTFELISSLLSISVIK